MLFPTRASLADRLEQSFGFCRVLDRKLEGASTPVLVHGLLTLDEIEVKQLLQLSMDLALRLPRKRSDSRRRDRRIALHDVDQREQAYLLKPGRSGLVGKYFFDDALHEPPQQFTGRIVLHRT